MRYLLALAIAAALLVFAPSAPASADTPGCASASELNKVGNAGRFYSKRRVHRVFDTNGVEVSGGDGVRKFAYDQCGASLDARITYVRYGGRWRMADMVA